ncbi:MAG: ATP phosphoribosyltransferase regulatory subunit, partial [Silvanigrellaceae bacterium]|nr:ATP phosphoribosyltransferase regulatory subunit [Silvanigrellaceae bacterium]
MEILSEFISPQSIVFSPDIVRGLDYYTGVVFEVFDTHPENKRALFGGGRYDNLIGCFSSEELPGIGYGMGDVALLNFMEVHQLTPKLMKQTDTCVVRFSAADRLASLKLADALRKEGLNVECNIANSKFGKQIQYAEKIKSLTVAFQGEDELKNNSFAVKWLRTGLQETYELNAKGIQTFKVTLKEHKKNNNFAIK